VQALPSSTSSSQQHLGITGHDQLTVDAQNDVDVALKNLVSNGTANAAQHWANHRKLPEKFAIVWDYLDKEEHVNVDKFLGTNRSTRLVSRKPLSDSPEWPFRNKGKGKETYTARYYVQESKDTEILVIVMMSKAGQLINFLLVLPELMKRTRRICGGFYLPLHK
jgi:hypothetical protein